MPVMHECPHHVVRVFRELTSKGKDAWNNKKEIKRSMHNEVNHENNSSTPHLSAMEFDKKGCRMVLVATKKVFIHKVIKATWVAS
jgi:hypothetical protein